MSQQFTPINNHIQGMRAHAYNPSTQNAEGGGSQTQGQSRVHKKKKKKKRLRKWLGGLSA